MAIILHCIEKALWDRRQALSMWGEEELASEGFIHFSQPYYFWRVAPNFKDSKAERVLLVVDTDRLISELRCEDGNSCGREYPHLYGLMNNDAVVDTLPFEFDSKGNWIKNPELQEFSDE